MRIPTGALAERNFRLLFAGATISGVGDGISLVALAFAVLKVSHSSPVVLGGVIAARQVANAAITLLAGVWADRVRRDTILIGASLAQGAAQVATGLLVIRGSGSVPLLLAFQATYGLAEGFIIPASTGLIPATVSGRRLQEANALLGLSQNGTRILGPAIGGGLVVLGTPGGALLVDAATFVAAAIFWLRLRVPERDEVIEAKPFFHDLREGWSYFKGQTWLWTTILFFGIGNFAASSYWVLGPVIAKQDLGGAPAWAAVTAANSVGAVVGGAVALRFRPRKPLAASCMCAWLFVLPTLGFGLGLPLPALIVLSGISGAGIAVHIALWFTVFQQNVPAEAMSRVSSYDAFGSFVLNPAGAAVAGPVAAVIGLRHTLLVAAAVILVTEAIVFAQPSVHAIRARNPEPEVEGA
jgi:MFS family permease